MAAPPINILIAVNDDLFRAALVLFLGIQEGFLVMGQALTSADVSPLCHQLQPDVLLMDLELRPAVLIPFIRQLRQAQTNLAIVVLAPRQDNTPPHQYLQAGAAHYLPREIYGSDIAAAIRRIDHHQG